MANITTEHLAENLKLPPFVLLKRPPTPNHSTGRFFLEKGKAPVGLRGMV